MTAELLRGYLASDEPLDIVGTGTLLDDANHESVSIGMTDRRFLCVSQAETFVSVGYDDVSSVRTRRRTRTAVTGTDYRLLMALGGLLAVLGFVGVFALGPGSLAPALTIVTAGCLAVADSVRNDGVQIEWEQFREDVGKIVAKLDGIDAVRPVGRQVVADIADTENDRLLLAASSLLGAIAFLGVILSAVHVLAPIFALVSIGGVALTAQAYRRRGDFEETALVQQNERVVRIDTTGGRTVSVRIDADAGFDRQLCRAAYADRQVSANPRSKLEIE